MKKNTQVKWTYKKLWPSMPESGNGECKLICTGKEVERHIGNVHFANSITETEANAALICEAVNVANETGLYPLELKDKVISNAILLDFQTKINKEMREALDEADNYFNRSWTGKGKLAKRVSELITKSLLSQTINNKQQS